MTDMYLEFQGPFAVTFKCGVVTKGTEQSHTWQGDWAVIYNSYYGKNAIYAFDL